MFLSIGRKYSLLTHSYFKIKKKLLKIMSASVYKGGFYIPVKISTLSFNGPVS
jgi:hypothetical protein